MENRGNGFAKIENIGLDQLEKYREILKLDSVENIDDLIIKYKDVLSDYYFDDIYDIDRLKLIVQAFCFFLSPGQLQIDYDKLKSQELKLNKKVKAEKDVSKYLFSETIYMVMVLISNKILKECVETEMSQMYKIYDILNFMFSTISPIEEYEKEICKTKSIF